MKNELNTPSKMSKNITQNDELNDWVDALEN